MRPTTLPRSKTAKLSTGAGHAVSFRRSLYKPAMALQVQITAAFPTNWGIPLEKSACYLRKEMVRVPAWGSSTDCRSIGCSNRLRVYAIDHKSGGGGGGGDSSKKGSGVPISNYVVPIDKSPSSSCITRPLAEILRDLNKRIPNNILKPHSGFIPWYHANRMPSFYAPGWCGEFRDVIFSDNRSITVVYRVTIRGSDGEAHRESTGTISSNEEGHLQDQVAAAEEIAFVRACARFGLGLYLYHED